MIEGTLPSKRRAQGLILALVLALTLASGRVWETNTLDDFLVTERTNVTTPGPDGSVRLDFNTPHWDILFTNWPSLDGWERGGHDVKAVMDVDPPGTLFIYDANDKIDPMIVKSMTIPDLADWTLETTFRMGEQGGLRICFHAIVRGPCFVLHADGIDGQDDKDRLFRQWEGKTDTDNYHTWRIMFNGASASFNVYRDGIRLLSHGDALRGTITSGQANRVRITTTGTRAQPAKIHMKDLKIANGKQTNRFKTGTLISSHYDSGMNETIYTTLSWDSDVTSPCTIKFQTRASSTVTELEGEKWLGPDKKNDYYTESATGVNNLHIGKRWIQYRVLFSSDGFCTPALKAVRLLYSNATELASSPEELKAVRKLITSEECSVPVQLTERYFNVLLMYDTNLQSSVWRLMFRVTDEDAKRFNASMTKIENIMTECNAQGDMNLAEVEIGNMEEKLDLNMLDAVTEWIDIFGLIGIIYLGLQFAKKRVIGHEEVEVMRGVTREGNHIKIGIKVQNHSTFSITDVDVNLDVPDAFEVEHGSKLISLGAIKPEEFQSAIFLLIPHRCVNAKIGGTVVYHDNKGERKMVEFNPINVGSVCPFLVGVPMNTVAFKKKIAEMESNQQTIELTIPPKEAIKRVAERFSGIHTVKQLVNKEKRSVDLIYSGMGAYSKKFLGIWVRMDLGLGVIYVTVFGEKKEMITGLISELVDHFKDETSGEEAGYYSRAKMARPAHYHRTDKKAGPKDAYAGRYPAAGRYPTAPGEGDKGEKDAADESSSDNKEEEDQDIFGDEGL